MNIILMRRAERSLTRIQDYIAERSPRAAERTIDRILQFIRTLAAFPMMAPQGALDGTRESVVPNTPYRVIYTIGGDLLRVLDVVHTSRRWPPR